MPTIGSDDYAPVLLETEGSVDGEIVTTSGYYAQDDGASLTYRWDASSTLTPDGADATHPGLIYKPSGTAGAGRWIAQVSRGAIDARWFGVKADNTQDDTSFIQAAIDRAINIDSTWPWSSFVVRLPAGLIKTTDTLHLGYGNGYSTISLVGETEGPGSFDLWGTVLRPTFTDVPVINVQGGRSVRIRNIGIVGLGSFVPYDGQQQPKPLADWDIAYSTEQYQQTAAIAVDAYSPAEPSGVAHYENAPDGWSKYHSSDVRVIDCHIEKFGCGIIIKPSGADANGDYVQAEGTAFQNCRYAFSVNSSQSRGNRLFHCKVSDCYAAVGIGWYGPTVGRDVFVESTAIEGCTWIIHGQLSTWLSQIQIKNCFGERCVGVINVDNAGGKCCTEVSGNAFYFFNGDDSTNPTRVHISAIGHFLKVSNNHFNVSGETKAIFIIVGGVNNIIENNIVRSDAAGYGGPIMVIIPNISVNFNTIIQNNSSNLMPSPVSDTIAEETLLGASYIGSRQFSGTPQTIVNLAVVGEFIAVASNSFVDVDVFKLISNNGSTAVLEQVTNCTAANPISSATTLARLTPTPGTTQTYNLVPVAPIRSAGQPLLP